MSSIAASVMRYATGSNVKEPGEGMSNGMSSGMTSGMTSGMMCDTSSNSTSDIPESLNSRINVRSELHQSALDLSDTSDVEGDEGSSAGKLYAGPMTPTADIKFNESDIDSIEVYDSVCHNILTVGESRTGKSTHIECLRNIHHRTSLEVWRGTEIPTSSTTLFKINKTYITTNILDMPGFGEASKSMSRSDDNIQSLITEFVKRDITRISLILIAVNGSGGITAAQVANITKCLKFLGKQVSSKACFLVTHFENRTMEDEQKWMHEFKANPNMRFLIQACQGGFLFTGALNDVQFKNVAVRDEYIGQQKRRNAELFKKLLSGSPVALQSDQMRDAKSMFAVQESVTTSCMNLRAIIPEVESMWKHVINTRGRISTYISKGIKDPPLSKLAADTVQKMGVADADGDISEMKLDNDINELIVKYDEAGIEIRARYVKVLNLLNMYNELDQAGSLVLNELDWS